MMEALLILNGMLIGVIAALSYAKFLSVKQAEAVLKEAAAKLADAQIIQAQQLVSIEQRVSDLSQDVNARRLR